MTAAGRMEEYELLRQQGGEQRRQPFEELEQHVFEPLPLHTANKQPPGLLRLRPRLRSLLLAAALLAIAISVFVIMTVKNVSGATSQEPTAGLSMIRGGYADKLLSPDDNALGALGKGGSASDNPQDEGITQTAYRAETTSPADVNITSADTTNEVQDVMSADTSALETPTASTSLLTTLPTDNDTLAEPSPFPTDDLTSDKQVLANADGLEKSYEISSLEGIGGESTLANLESTLPWPIPSSQPTQTPRLSADSPAQNESSISAGLENKGAGIGNVTTNAEEGNVKGDDSASVDGSRPQANDLETGKGDGVLTTTESSSGEGEEGKVEADPIGSKVSNGTHNEHANTTNSGSNPEPASSVSEGVQPPTEAADDGGDGRMDTQLDQETKDGGSDDIFAEGTNVFDPTSAPASSAETDPADTLETGILSVNSTETSATAAATVTETPRVNTSDVLGVQPTAIDGDYNLAYAESSTADQVQPTAVSEQLEGGNLFTGTVSATNYAVSLASANSSSADLDDIATSLQGQSPLPSVNAASERPDNTAANLTLTNGVLPDVGHDIGVTGHGTDAEVAETGEGKRDEKQDEPGDRPDEHEDEGKKDDVDESSSAEYSRRRLPRTSIFPHT